MRQFDVIITPAKVMEPPFTDKDLGWFHGDSINELLDCSEAEWIVFADPCIKIDRQFLNNLAETISGFPMVDAFAPRIRTPQGTFHNGLRLDSKNGFAKIASDAELRFVAAPHPKLAVFSRRIVQRIGRMDASLPTEIQLADFCLRMLHAGGRMFHVPYLVAESSSELESAESIVCNRTHTKALATIISKSLDALQMLSFGLHHPTTLTKLFFNNKEFKEKRQKATDLSKLSKQTILDISKP